MIFLTKPLVFVSCAWVMVLYNVLLFSRFGHFIPEVNPSWGGRDLSQQSRPALGPTESPVQLIPGLFQRGKVAGGWRGPPTPIYHGRQFVLPNFIDYYRYTGHV
jgi:hypothetical protein